MPTSASRRMGPRRSTAVVVAWAVATLLGNGNDTTKCGHPTALFASAADNVISSATTRVEDDDGIVHPPDPSQAPPPTTTTDVEGEASVATQGSGATKTGQPTAPFTMSADNAMPPETSRDDDDDGIVHTPDRSQAQAATADAEGEASAATATQGGDQQKHQQQQQQQCHWGTPSCHANSQGGGRENSSAADHGSSSGSASSSRRKNIGQQQHQLPFVHPGKKSTAEGTEASRSAARPDEKEERGAAAAKSAVSSESSPNATKAGVPMRPRGMASVHRPPEGFALAARVVADADDGLSYFVDDASDSSSSSSLLVPFLECGAVGSTTAQVLLKHGTFRHLPAGAEPREWVTTGPNPQLVVALHPLEIIVSGGESRVFHPGDVILMEDTIGKGHKMRAAPTTATTIFGGSGSAASAVEERNLSVILLTLPHRMQSHPHLHSPAEDDGAKRRRPHLHLSLFGRGGAKKMKDGEIPEPCMTEHDPAYRAVAVTPEGRGNGYLGIGAGSARLYHLRSLAKAMAGFVGSVLSVFALAKLSEVLTVRASTILGAACVIVLGTIGFVLGGERALDDVELWREEFVYQRRHRKEEKAEGENNVGIEASEKAIPVPKRTAAA